MAERSYRGRRKTQAEATAIPAIREPEQLKVLSRPVETYVPPRRDNTVGMELLYASLARTSSVVTGQLDKAAENLKEKQANVLRGEWVAYVGDETEGKPSVEGFRAWRQDQGKSGWLGLNGGVIADAEGATRAANVGSQLLAEATEGTLPLFSQETGESVSLSDASPGDIVHSIDLAFAAGASGLSPISAGSYAVESETFRNNAVREALKAKQNEVAMSSRTAVAGNVTARLSAALSGKGDVSDALDLGMLDFGAIPGISSGESAELTAVVVMSLADSMAMEGNPDDIRELEDALAKNEAWNASVHPKDRARVYSVLRTAQNDAELQIDRNEKVQIDEVVQILASSEPGEPLSDEQNEELKKYSRWVLEQAQKKFYENRFDASNARAKYLVSSGQGLPPDADPLLIRLYEEQQTEVAKYFIEKNPEVKEKLRGLVSEAKSEYRIPTSRANDQGLPGDLQTQAKGIARGDDNGGAFGDVGVGPDYEGYNNFVSRMYQRARRISLDGRSIDEQFEEIRSFTFEQFSDGSVEPSTQEGSTPGDLLDNITTTPPSQRPPTRVANGLDEFKDKVDLGQVETDEELHSLIYPNVSFDPTLNVLNANEVAASGVPVAAAIEAARGSNQFSEYVRELNNAAVNFRSPSYGDKNRVGQFLEDMIGTSIAVQTVMTAEDTARLTATGIPGAIPVTDLEDLGKAYEVAFDWVVENAERALVTTARNVSSGVRREQIRKGEIQKGIVALGDHLFLNLLKSIPFVPVYNPSPPPVPDITQPSVSGVESPDE